MTENITGSPATKDTEPADAPLSDVRARRAPARGGTEERPAGTAAGNGLSDTQRKSIAAGPGAWIPAHAGMSLTWPDTALSALWDGEPRGTDA